MNQFFASALQKAKDNKAFLIKVGSALAGALVGTFVATALTAESESIMLDGVDVEVAASDE